MRQHLLIDADDTLWENNIYFEDAVHAFISFLNHSRLTPAEVRAVLDEAERQMGYGAAAFTRSLETTYRQLAEKELLERDLQQVRQFGEQLQAHPLQLLEGVRETLEYLAGRHDLILVTKGDHEEQSLKVEHSGVEELFKQVMIVPEKDVQTYQHIVSEVGLEPYVTWMIGNSPRSDINPALAAGLNAVYIPHPHTWHFEHARLALVRKGRFLQLASFSELRSHF